MGLPWAGGTLTEELAPWPPDPTSISAGRLWWWQELASADTGRPGGLVHLLWTQALADSAPHLCWETRSGFRP